MTYNVFGGTLSLTQSINPAPGVCYFWHRGVIPIHLQILLTVTCVLRDVLLLLVDKMWAFLSCWKVI